MFGMGTAHFITTVSELNNPTRWVSESHLFESPYWLNNFTHAIYVKVYLISQDAFNFVLCKYICNIFASCKISSLFGAN